MVKSISVLASIELYAAAARSLFGREQYFQIARIIRSSALSGNQWISKTLRRATSRRRANLTLQYDDVYGEFYPLVICRPMLTKMPGEKVNYAAVSYTFAQMLLLDFGRP